MSVNPFDIKTVLLAKHAQQVVLIFTSRSRFLPSPWRSTIAHTGPTIDRWQRRCISICCRRRFSRCQSWPRVLSRGSWP
jgi:hypothetical protein